MRKNILIFGHTFATQFIDISNQYTQLFDKKKYKVTVAYLIGPSCDDVRNRHLAEEVIFFNLPLRAVRYWKFWAIGQLLQLQRKNHFHIVICHRYKPTYIMLWVAKCSRITALIFVMHELNTLKNHARKLILASLWQKNMVLAGVSNAVREDLQRDSWRVPAQAIITLYNAIDVPTIAKDILTRTQARQQLNLPQDSFIFGTIGRLVPAKSQFTLIEAFTLIKPKCAQAKLVIIGDGELMPMLQKKILDLNLINDIVLLGFVPRAFRFIKAFNLFVLSSVKEAFGRVLLEAMVAKVPIIATDIHGIPEVIGNTGTLVNVQNAEQLAEKMVLYYNMGPAELNQWTAGAYQRVVKEFSTTRFKEIFWQLPLLKSEACS